mmetsp:Transcript_25110/g.65502  ORF Transcript_25110/g.65502 Transcript_25110/m.65502 type:complete len:333 (-) Transcript_25110:779-1777(-)
MHLDFTLEDENKGVECGAASENDALGLGRVRIDVANTVSSRQEALQHVTREARLLEGLHVGREVRQGSKLHLLGQIHHQVPGESSRQFVRIGALPVSRLEIPLLRVVRNLVVLIDDLIADDFLNDIFQRRHPNHFEAVVSALLVFDNLFHNHNVRVAFFEPIQEVIQQCVVPNGGHFVVVELYNGLEWQPVVGVDKHEFLGVQDALNVSPPLAVHRDSGVARINDLRHRLEVQDRIPLQHVHVVDGRHDLLDHLVGEREGTLDDLHFVVVEVGEILRHLQHVDELMPGVERANLTAEHVVQNHRDRLGRRVRDNHEEERDRESLGADVQPVP